MKFHFIFRRAKQKETSSMCTKKWNKETEYLSARVYDFSYGNDEMQVVWKGAVNSERCSSSIMCV